MNYFLVIYIDGLSVLAAMWTQLINYRLLGHRGKANHFQGRPDKADSTKMSTGLVLYHSGAVSFLD